MQDLLSLETLMDALGTIGTPPATYVIHSAEEMQHLAQRGAPPCYLILVQHSPLTLEESERRTLPPTSFPVAFTRTQTLIGATAEYFPDGTICMLHAAPIAYPAQLDMNALGEHAAREMWRLRHPREAPAAEEAPPIPN